MDARSSGSGAKLVFGAKEGHEQEPPQQAATTVRTNVSGPRTLGELIVIESDDAAWSLWNNNQFMTRYYELEEA